MTTPAEPRIWSHITDTLPEDHPLAWKTTYCGRCGGMVHAGNNECMRTWVETGRGAYCLQCFAAIDETEDLDEGGWGLHSSPPS